jgi:hypothetical protein
VQLGLNVEAIIGSAYAGLVSANGILSGSSSKLRLLVFNLASVPGGQLVNSLTAQSLERYMQKLMKIFILILTFSICCVKLMRAQPLGWTKQEMGYYTKTKEFCMFLKSNPYDPSKREYIFSNYILFTNTKNDTSQQRLNYFDGLFYGFYHFIDSVGLENLDAKPVRYFKSDSIFYKPFVEDLKWADSLSLAYFDKREPEKPLGSLLYDLESGNLVSWMILNMGGYLYLTPNLY